MRKVIVVPDSFKGSLSSIEICNIVKDEVKKYFPECEVVALPVADGGEGTVDCFLEAIGGKRVKVKTTGPWMEDITAEYALINELAIIEMASCAGLPLAGNNLNPSLTTTFGVGQVIYDAVKRGAKEIILGLGGSCTNDGGCGCAAALGVEFKNEEGNAFIPTGDSLSRIKQIDVSDAKALLEDCQITAMCDIDNPMFGKKGAAYVFAPQKGADNRMVIKLDEELRALSKLIKGKLNIADIDTLPGGAAAGAMGAGVYAFLGAELKSGIETVLDIVDFDNKLEDADFVITGEGKIDSQSLRGKVVSGVAKRSKLKNVPVIAIVGDVDDDAYEIYNQGVTSIFSINRKAIPFEEARLRSKEDYRHTLSDILKLLSIK